MKNNTSVLTFFSSDAALSKRLESELGDHKKKLSQITTDTSEQELILLQGKIDGLQTQTTKLRTIKLKTLSTADFKALPHIKLKQLTDKQEYEQRKALILHCSELAPEQFNTLHSPDFIQLYENIADMVLKPSDEIQGSKLNGERFEFDLLHPFKNEAGDDITRIKFKVPKVVHTEALADLDEDEQREDFMFRVVTGLEAADFKFLSLNDYLALKAQVGAFFQPSAGFFRSKTLNL